MSDTEVEYITSSIIPLVEKVAKHSNNDDAMKMKAGLDLVKPILSKETVTIMQILGFNFRKALGEPLTELTSSLIKSKMPINQDYNDEMKLVAAQREVEYIKVCQDKEAYGRLMNLYNKG